MITSANVTYTEHAKAFRWEGQTLEVVRITLNDNYPGRFTVTLSIDEVTQEYTYLILDNLNQKAIHWYLGQYLIVTPYTIHSMTKTRYDAFIGGFDNGIDWSLSKTNSDKPTLEYDARVNRVVVVRGPEV